MADYTDWDINDYLPGKPYTSAKAISQHENLDAVAEGAANAPRILLPALEGLSAGDQDRSVKPFDIAGVSGDPDTSPAPGGAKFSFAFVQRGGIRCRAVKTSGSVTGEFTVTRTRNGTTTTAIADEPLTNSVDVSVEPGDLVEISVTTVATGSSSTLVGEMQFRTDGQNLWPGSQARLEGNNV